MPSRSGSERTRRSQNPGHRPERSGIIPEHWPSRAPRYPEDVQTTVSDPLSERFNRIWCDVGGTPFGEAVPPPTFASPPKGGTLTPWPSHPLHLIHVPAFTFGIVVVPTTVIVWGAFALGIATAVRGRDTVAAIFFVPPQPARLNPRTANNASPRIAFTHLVIRRSGVIPEHWPRRPCDTWGVGAVPFTEVKCLALLTALAAVALAASGCAGSHHASTPTTSGGATVASGADPAIASVQASWPILRIFPKTPSTNNHCLLPGPGESRGIKGTCRTATSVGGLGPEVVTFTEIWPGTSFRLSGSTRGTQHHSWRFVVSSPGGRVTLVGEHGNFPPQSTQ